MLRGLTLAAIVAVIVGCSKESEPLIPPAQIIPYSPLKEGSNTLMSNGGGTGTTDWDTYTKSGVPEGWKVNQYGKCSLISGIYWKGNALKVQSRSQFMLDSPPAPDNGSAWHTITIKYRSDTEVRLAVKYSPTCTYCIMVLPVSPKPDYVTVRFWAPEIRFLRFYNSPIKPGCIELDEINLN